MGTILEGKGNSSIWSRMKGSFVEGVSVAAQISRVDSRAFVQSNKQTKKGTRKGPSPAPWSTQKNWGLGECFLEYLSEEQAVDTYQAERLYVSTPVNFEHHPNQYLQPKVIFTQPLSSFLAGDQSTLFTEQHLLCPRPKQIRITSKSMTKPDITCLLVELGKRTN